MSDFRGVLRGTFISDQYHCWKYRACFSLFHCCFGNISNCFRSIFAFQKRNTNAYFFGNALGNVLCSFFSSTFLTLKAGWVRTWSGSTLSGLSVEQAEVLELTAPPSLAFISTENKGVTLWPSRQWTSSAWSFFKGGRGWTFQPRFLSHNHSLKSSI